MNLLLDTHIVLWWLADASELPAGFRVMLSDPGDVCYISAVSIWEISIKSRLGKLEIDGDYTSILRQQGFFELPVTWAHCTELDNLPMYHSDPFDRLLIAQARVEHLYLMSVDRIFEKYDVNRA